MVRVCEHKDIECRLPECANGCKINTKTDQIVKALRTLSEFGVPIDVQEVLLYGSLQRRVRRGALKAVIEAVAPQQEVKG